MTIEQKTPSEILPQITDIDCTLARLVLSGYDLKASALENPMEAVKYEYDYSDERTIIFVARQGDEAIGSMTLIKWLDTPTDKRGKLFFPKLSELDQDLANKVSGYNSLVVDVAGVVVHPDHRGKGVARALLNTAIKELKPAIIEGQTKTVGAVALRSSIDGYRTFYGGNEVTAEKVPNVPNSYLHLHEAFRFAREIYNVRPEGLSHVYPGEIAPTIPDTQNYPLAIQRAFEPIVKAQINIGLTGDTVMAFLLSVKSELLEK